MVERENPDFAKHLLLSLGRLKCSGEFCDFNIKVGEEEIPVHRNVLSAASPFFEAMLTRDTVEKERGWAEFPDLDQTAVKQCIEFIYTGKAKLSYENPKDLMHASDLMQLKHLTNLYFEYLLKNISVTNCLMYMELAVKYNQEAFGVYFEDFLLKNFAKLVAGKEFLQMHQDVLSQCLKALKTCGEESELLKWKAITNWAKGDYENRKELFPELFKLINLEQLREDFIKNKMRSEDLVKNSMVCVCLILDALCAVPIQHNLDQLAASKKSKNTFLKDDDPTDSCEDTWSNLLVLGKQSQMLHKMNLSTEEWSRFVRIPEVLGEVNIAAIGNEIYVITQRSIKKYSGGKWRKLTAREVLPRNHQQLVLNGCIWFIGNCGITKFNPKKNTWSRVDSELYLGTGFACTFSSGFLCAVGGENTEKRAYEFDFISKRWKPLLDMRWERTKASACGVQSDLVVIGGYCNKWAYNTCGKYLSKTNVRQISSYSFLLNTWTDIGSLDLDCSNFKVLAQAETIYIFEKTKIYTGTVEAFSQKNDSCRTITSPTHVEGVASFS